QRSHYTADLYMQYQKHLGTLRYPLLLESQKLVVPRPVGLLLQFRNESKPRPLIALYKIAKILKLDELLKTLLLPSKYLTQIRSLHIPKSDPIRVKKTGCPFHKID